MDMKVLGTFLTEWDEGAAICNTLLSSKTSARMYAERLTELATALGFDGWLVIRINPLFFAFRPLVHSLSCIWLRYFFHCVNSDFLNFFT